MKPFKGKQKEFTGQFDEVHEERRPRKHRKFVEEDDENFWPKHPTDVSDYLDNDEDFHTPTSRS